MRGGDAGGGESGLALWHERSMQPFFQQAHRVHAVLSDLNDGFPTIIRSDDSMRADPLTDCISAISHRNSCGYFKDCA